MLDTNGSRPTGIEKNMKLKKLTVHIITAYLSTVGGTKSKDILRHNDNVCYAEEEEDNGIYLNTIIIKLNFTKKDLQIHFVKAKGCRLVNILYCHLST